VVEQKKKRDAVMGQSRDIATKNQELRDRLREERKKHSEEIKRLTEALLQETATTDS